MNLLKSIIREFYQNFEVPNFFVNGQFFKLQKILEVHLRIHNNLFTNQISLVPLVCLYQG